LIASKKNFIKNYHKAKVISSADEKEPNKQTTKQAMPVYVTATYQELVGLIFSYLLNGIRELERGLVRSIT
jgi:hypothetical protein